MGGDKKREAEEGSEMRRHLQWKGRSSFVEDRQIGLLVTQADELDLWGRDVEETEVVEQARRYNEGKLTAVFETLGGHGGNVLIACRAQNFTFSSLRLAHKPL